MTRSTWNPNFPEALGLEFLGVGTVGYGFPSTANVQQRGLRFRAQRTGQIDRLTLHSGPSSSVPVLSADIFAGHRLPYIAELIPRDQLDTGGSHTLTPIASRVQTTGFMIRGGASGAIQSGDLATQNGIGVRPTSSAAFARVDLASGSFPLDRQIASVAITWSAFASNLQVGRRGDLNLPIGSDMVPWQRVLAGGTDNWHLGELWIEGGDTTTWHEVTPQMIRQFDSTIGGQRRLELQTISFNPNFIYDLLAVHVDSFQERRVGTGVIELPATSQKNILVDIPFHAPGATGTPVDFVAGEEYVLVIRNPYGGSRDYSSASLLDLRTLSNQRGETTVDHFEGLDWDWHTLTNYDAGDTTSGTRDLRSIQLGLPTALFSFAGLPTVDSQPYLRTWGGRASQASGEVLRQHNVPNPSPVTEYRSFRFNVSLGQTLGGGASSTPNDPLQVSFTNPGADDPFLGPFSLATSEVEALGTTLNRDELGHMYFPVTIDFGEGVQFPTLFDVLFESVSDADRPWRIAVLQASTETGGDETYGAGSVTYSSPAPVVTGSAVTSFSTEVTSHPLNIPATVSSGDLLIAMGDWRSSTAEVPLDPAGWTRISNDVYPHAIFAKAADGTEGGTTVNLATDIPTSAVGIVVRIVGQHPTFSEAIATGPGSGSGGAPSAEPNPPEAVQPADWFTAPVRAIALAGWRDDDAALVSNPAGYTAGASGVSGAGVNAGAGMAFAHRIVTTGSEDPGNFLIADSEGWDAQTLLVRPEPDAGGNTGSFATGFALDPVTGAVVPLSGTTLDDLEFTLFTQAPEVTGLDVSVLAREGEGATCTHLDERPVEEMLTESFNKANGELGPDLTWSREVYEHEFELEVVSQRARFLANQSGTWTDIQVPTPNFTSPDVTVSFDVTSVATTGSGTFTVEARALTRLQLLGSEGESYRAYVARIARTNSPSDLWTLSISRADGADDLEVLVASGELASAVTLPGRLTFTSRGNVHTAVFTHAGSGAALEVTTTDSTYDSGVSALSAVVNNGSNLVTRAITLDNFEVDELVVVECTTCRRPQITYPRVCWSPTQLDIEDFDFFELQRQETGQEEFETIEVFQKEDPSVTAIGAALTEDDLFDDHPAPSLTAVGDELLFCHWHSWTPGDYSVTGTGMNPLGTVARFTAGGSVLSTPDRDLFATSQLDIRMKIRPNDWTPPGFFTPTLGQWAFNNVDDGWLTSVTTTGQLSFQYTVDGGTDVTRTSGVATGFVDGTTHWVRFVFTGNNGAGQNVTKFFTSEDGVTWTQLGATQTNAGTVTIWPSTASLRFNQGLVYSGDVYHLEVRNGENGPVIADPSFHSLLPGATTLEDSARNTWTVTGAAIVDGNELRGPDTSSIAAWEQVSAGATGTRFAEIVPDTAYATMSVLVRGIEGSPVLEEVVTNLETDGVTITTSEGVERGQWLLALFGSPAGAGSEFGPPDPGSWQLIVDSGETVADRPRVAAWVRPVVDDGAQVVNLPQTNDPNAPLDYHLRVVVLSNVSEFMVTCYDDWSVSYGNEVCYQVRQGRTDGSISDWSPPVCETVPAPEGVDLVITAPARPELNAAYNEAHGGLPTSREYTFLDADDVSFRAVYGRDNQLAFRPLETRGVTFRRNLLVSPLCQAEVPCLEVMRPLRDLMTEPVPFLVVRDTCGNRWYANLTVSSATRLSSPQLPDLWTAQIEVVELAAPILETPAGAQET